MAWDSRLRFRGEAWVGWMLGPFLIEVMGCFCCWVVQMDFEMWKYWFKRPLNVVFLFTGTSLSFSSSGWALRLVFGWR